MAKENSKLMIDLLDDALDQTGAWIDSEGCWIEHNALRLWVIRFENLTLLCSYLSRGV